MIDIDEKDLKLSVDWIIKKQQDNGCFPVVGKVFHKEMKVKKLNCFYQCYKNYKFFF